MASEADHIACANRTQQTIKFLLADRAVHSPWIAISEFYKALHVVEAVFSNDVRIRHTVDHGTRENRLVGERRYQKICEHYLPLSRASLKARYLSSCTSFDQHMSPDVVVDELLKHRMRQIEASARKFLKNPDALIGIETAF